MRRTSASGTNAADHAATGGATGAMIGTVLGGGAGLLASIGALAFPGVGPVVAAGWLVATLTGAGVSAATLGLVGSLTTVGVSRDEAQIYAEGVTRGGSLVTVRTDEANVARVEDILAQHGPIDWQTRRTDYGNDLVGAEDTIGAGVSGRNPAIDPGRHL